MFDSDTSLFNALPATLRVVENLNQRVERITRPPEQKGTGLGLKEWASRHRRIDNNEFSFERFRPLEELYEDQHPHIVVKKPAQVGISEWAVNYAVWAMDEGADYWGLSKEGINVAYCFPTATALSDFSKERVSALRRETPYLRELFSGSGWDDVGFKQIAASYLYLRGAWTVDALLSFAADVLILDEFDRMNAAAVQLAKKRLRQSQVQRELDISTPTVPGVGIDALYHQSDQRVWEVECEACREFSELDFHRDCRMLLDGAWAPMSQWQTVSKEEMLQGEWTIACPQCAEPIDRCGPGRWTAKAPEIQSLRGYQIPALSFPVVNLATLAASAVDPDPSVQMEFYRSDLGLAYEPAGSRVTVDMILRLSAALSSTNGKIPADLQWTRTTMGVDVGGVYHYKVTSTGSDGKRYTRWMGEARSWDELTRVMNEYNVLLCVVDALPEIHGCKQWAETMPGRVYRAFYPQIGDMRGQLFRVDSPTPEEPAPRRTTRPVQKKRDPDVVNVNRTMAMDAVYAMIAAQGEIWPASLTRIAEVQEQMTAPVRVAIVDKHGQERLAWAHTKPDHYYHAAVYCHIAESLLPNANFGLEALLATGVARGGWSAQ